MEIINIIVILGGVLLLLAAWLIYRSISFEKRMKNYVKDTTDEAIEDAVIYADKMTASAKLKLLAIITTTQIDLDNWNAVALICSYMPEALMSLDAPEEDINIAVTTMQMIYKDGKQTHISLATTTKLRDSIVPLLERSKLAELFYAELSGIMIETTTTTTKNGCH